MAPTAAIVLSCSIVDLSIYFMGPRVSGSPWFCREEVCTLRTSFAAMITIICIAISPAAHADEYLPRCSKSVLIARFVCQVDQLQYKLEAPFRKDSLRPNGGMKEEKYKRRVAYLMNQYWSLLGTEQSGQEMWALATARARLRFGCAEVVVPRDLGLDFGAPFNLPKGAFCSSP